MIIIGHRGASGHAPENTLAAFRLAEEMGCAWVELDVHHLEDELLVIHDDIVDRTTSGTGSLTDLGLAKVRQLDAGSGERVPTLKEVLDLLAGRVSINIELKGPGTAEPVSALLLHQCQAGPWQPDHFLLSSFNHRELAKADPTFARGVLWGKSHPDMIPRTLGLNGQWMNIALRNTHEALVEAAHQAGLKVAVYTVNEPDHLLALADMGVDAVFSDYPDRGLDAGFSAANS